VERSAGAAHLGAAALILDLDALLDGPLDAAVFVGWRGISPSFEGQMMRHFGALLAVCFGLLLTAAAHAAPVFEIGSGLDSCGKYIAALGDAPPGKYREMNTARGVYVSENKVYQAWLLGFVTGFNAVYAGDLEQQVTKIDPAGMDLWMRNWCNQHPTQTVLDGAIAFINEMLTNAARKQ
jgi:hypothetical protein